MHYSRRTFIRTIITASLGSLFRITDPEAGVIRRRRRRMRRRVRRRVIWRMVNGRRVLVIPVDVGVGDKLVLEDGSTAGIITVSKGTLTIKVHKKAQTVPVIYEGRLEGLSI
jgi:hypothetical protein